MADVTILEYERKVESRLGLLIRAVSFTVYDMLGTETPRKTGRTAASWTIALNRPRWVQKPPGKYSTPSAASELGGARVGADDGVYIANGCPWIAKLNAGSSRQAPAHFVERAVVRTQDAFPGVATAVIAADGGL